MTSNTPDDKDYEQPEHPRAEPAETAGQPTEDEVWYHGIGSGAGGCTVAIENPDGTPTGVLQHVVRHSPTGMSWGYQGSGPADTARSLLIAALGEDAKCGSCAGTRRVVYDPSTGEEPAPTPYDPSRAPAEHASAGLEVARCWECDDGYRRLPYQDFKCEHVATWDDEWRISRSQIHAWLREHEENQAGRAPDWPSSQRRREPEAGE